MTSSYPDDYPISGLCVVSDPQKCPPNYELMYKSYDRRDDCDLWKDSFFKARITRYLCFTRKYPNEGNRANSVLVDVAIQNDKELPPSGYTLLENTSDTNEKATRKKQICVKFLPRNATQDAVTELIILSGAKRAFPGYTLAGEVNGLLICFKLGSIPPETQNLPEPSTPATPSQFTTAPFSQVQNRAVYHPYSAWSSPRENLIVVGHGELTLRSAQAAERELQREDSLGNSF